MLLLSRLPSTQHLIFLGDMMTSYVSLMGITIVVMNAMQKKVIRILGSLTYTEAVKLYKAHERIREDTAGVLTPPHLSPKDRACVARYIGACAFLMHPKSHMVLHSLLLTLVFIALAMLGFYPELLFFAHILSVLFLVGSMLRVFWDL